MVFIQRGKSMHEEKDQCIMGKYMQPFRDYLNINSWTYFQINHSQLNGISASSFLKNIKLEKSDLMERGIYCYSCKSYSGKKSVCLRIGIAFGAQTTIFSRFNCHCVTDPPQNDRSVRLNLTDESGSK